MKGTKLEFILQIITLFTDIRKIMEIEGIIMTIMGNCYGHVQQMHENRRPKAMTTRRQKKQEKASY